MFLLAIVCNSTRVFSQTQTKFDFYLATKQQELAKGTINGSDLLPVLVKGNISEIKKLVATCRGTFKYNYGNIAAVQIPASALPSFAQNKSIIRMEGKPLHMRVMNDTMRVRNHMVEVEMGQSPLTQAYNGEGVILAFIDSGIDFLHPDFQDTTKRTRIKFLWDQNTTTGPNTPMPYGYGKEWSQQDMDSALDNSDSITIKTIDSCSTYEFGHGSNVAGAGSGNARSNGRCMGADPKSDIIMVAFNFNSNNPTLMTDAMDYILTKATQLGEPVVINASLGDYEGSHDGQDLQAQMIDSMITARPGRCFVASAGNAGSIPYHVAYSVHPGDTLFTWHSYNGSYVDLQVYGDTANFKNVQFAIGADATTPNFSLRGQTGFSTISSYLNNPPPVILKNSNNQPLGTINYYGQLYGGTYSMEFYIIPDSTTYYWRFITTGTGQFDCWDFANVVYTGLPNVATFPDMRNYKMPDSNETICSSFQCSPHTITVGNYWNHGTMYDYDTVLTANALYEPCKLWFGSSKGPTRDGRLKPEITSAGNWTYSTMPLQFRAYDIVNSPNVLDIGGYHNADGGTSMAAPEVAGAAGMLLELHPNSTNDEIKTMITSCADQDTCTGSNLPNNSWGYGKLDAFKSMTNCGALGINAINNVPNSQLSVYPNPVMQSAIIDYDFSSLSSYCTAQIDVYDVMGKRVKSMDIKGPKGTLNFNKGDLEAGTYFYSLSVDGSKLRTEKMIVF